MEERITRDTVAGFLGLGEMARNPAARGFDVSGDDVVPGTALVTSNQVEAQAQGEGANGNQGLFRVYDRMSGQTRAAPGSGIPR